MKKFRVYATSSQAYYLDVMAKTIDEAEDIAKQIDGGLWDEIPESSSWEIQDDSTIRMWEENN